MVQVIILIGIVYLRIKKIQKGRFGVLVKAINHEVIRVVGNS